MMMEVDAREDGSFSIVSVTISFEQDNNDVPLGLAPSRWFPEDTWHRYGSRLQRSVGR